MFDLLEAKFDAGKWNKYASQNVNIDFFYVATNFYENDSIFAADANFLIRPKASETRSKMEYYNVLASNFSLKKSKVTRLMRLSSSFYWVHKNDKLTVAHSNARTPLDFWIFSMYVGVLYLNSLNSLKSSYSEFCRNHIRAYGLKIWFLKFCQ